MKININKKTCNVYGILFKNDKMIIDTDYDFNKNLYGEIFDFSIIPSGKETIDELSVRRSKNEKTIYFKIPVKFRKGISEYNQKNVSCTNIDNIFIFTMKKKE